MKVLIFDTETTGLIKRQEKDINKQPHMIQFAGIVIEINEKGEYTKEKEVNHKINPGIKIPFFISQINNIYDIDVKNEPKTHEILPEIVDLINSVDIIVGHNIAFDEGIIQLEVNRIKIKGNTIDYNPRGKICTMQSSVGVCRLPKKRGNGYKVPKLMELHKFLFGQNFSGAHDALVDVKATGRCLVRLVQIGVIKLKPEEKSQTNLF